MQKLLRKPFAAFVLLALMGALPLSAQTYKVVLDGLTEEAFPDLSSVQFVISDSEKLLTVQSPDNQKDLSTLGTDTSMGIKTSKRKASFKNGEASFTFTSKAQKVYYRFYSPHFTDVQKGSIDCSAPDEDNVIHLNIFQNKKAITVHPVKGRNGEEVDRCVFFANVNYGIYSNTSDRICNGVRMGKSTTYKTYTVFADKGTTMEYVVKPELTSCALAVCKLDVTDDDAPQSIDVDYSKAVKLKLCVTDSHGERISMENPPLQCTYYTDQSSNWGWGTYYGQMRLDHEVQQANGVAGNWVETYALPGSRLNLEIYNVYSWETSDPDFLFPYNCPTPYLVKEVEVRTDATEQEVVMGQSDPRDVKFTIKGGASLLRVLDLKVTAFYDFKFYPFPEEDKWDIARFKEVGREVDGNDLVYHLKVSGVAPRVTVTPQVNVYAQYNDTLWKADEALYGVMFYLPEAGSTKNVDILNLSKVHGVMFKARHGFLKTHMIALHSDAFLYDESFTHCIPSHKTDDEAVDSIVVYLAEGDYQWYTISSSTGAVMSDKADFSVTADGQVIVVDEAPAGIQLTPAGQASEVQGYYSVDGKRLSVPVRGVNILRLKDGRTIKVVR